MRYKKGVIFICLIICLFSIASVSAGDVNEKGVASEDQMMMKSQDMDLLEVENQSNVCLNDENKLSKSAGTFTDLANEINNANGELNLTRDYVYSINDSDDGILINKKITINGNGFTIDGNDRTRMFSIFSSQVILNNIHFKNSHCNGVSAGLMWYGDEGILINCSFIDCFTSSSGGAAVYWCGSNGFLEGCNFLNCFSDSGSSDYSSANGGTIYWSGLNGVLSKSIFINCTSHCSDYGKSLGGAVYWSGNNGFLEECRFIKCSSSSTDKSSSSNSFANADDGIGGAVYWQGNNGSLINCCFDNCSSFASAVDSSSSSSSYASASSNGGSIYWYGDNGFLSNCSFLNCSSSSFAYSSSCDNPSSASASAYGGGVYWWGINGSLSNCGFLDCSVFTLALTSTSSSTPYSSHPISNANVNSYGGGIYWSGSYGFLTNCSFENCSSSHDTLASYSSINSYGGGVYWSGNDGLLSDCNFINSTKYYVNKFNPHLYVDLNKNGFVFGEKIILTPNLFNESASVKIYVDDKFQGRIIIGDSFVLENLNAGIHTIKVVYEGNDFYKYSEITKKLFVSKINITKPTINVLNKEVICFELLFSDVDVGNITFDINNNSVIGTIINKTSMFNFNNLITNKVYECTLNYLGDINHNPCNISYIITIPLKYSYFTIYADNISVDDNPIIFYDIIENATGILSVYVNDRFIENVFVGNNIELNNLKAGNYTLRVVYGGDDNFATCDSLIKFEVYKYDSNYYIDYDEISNTDNANIKFIFDNDATGKFSISFGEWILDNKNNFIWKDINNFTCYLVNGEAIVPIPKLIGGWHDYLLVYEGDSRYKSLYEENDLYIDFKDSPININIPEINWSDNVTLKPILPKGATGNIHLLLDNISLANISLGDSFQYKVVKGGKHYLTIEYSGDEYFTYNETTVEFYVNKLNSNFNMENTFDSEKYITIPITLSDDANGDITVNVNNNIYSGKVVNGLFNFIVTDIGAGTHNLVINYTNDNKYNDIYTAKEITVNLKDSNLNFDIQNILAGQNLLIKPTLTEGATGSVDIYVDGSFKKSINIGSSYTLQNPGVGQHKVRLIYSGNTYFASCENEYSFRVFTIYPIETVDTQIVFGTDKKFQAKFFDEYGGVLANKYVLFIVNGEEYPVKTNGEGIAVLDVDLAVGEYNVTSVSLLDENTTNKLLIFHSVQAESMIMEYGSDTRFKATFLDETAKPLSNTNIIFKVDGKDIMVKTDVNGVAILNSELTLGTHTITSINTITDESMTNKVVVVKDVNSIITVETKDINYSQKATIKVNIDSNYLNANITIKVTGENGYEQIFTQKAANTITKELTGLNASKYRVDVKYEDSDLLVIQKNATFNVLKIDPSVTLSVDDGFVGQVITFEVKVSDSNGTLAVKIDDDLSEGQFVDGRFVMNINSLSVGKHSYEVLFNGDNNYNPIIKKGTFTIWNKLNFEVDFDSIEIYRDDECAMYVYIQNLTDNNNAILTLFIDGVKVKDQSFTIYEYDDEEYNGEIEFNAANLSEGIHNWKITYNDELNYINSSQTGLVKVYHVGNPDKIVLVTNDGIIADIDGEFVFVKNGTIIDDDYQEYYTIYSFTANGVEYAAIRWFPVTFYSVGCYKVFNPNEYKLFEGVYYKTTNGIISDVIDNYEEIDGVYYGYVGRPYEYYNNGYDKSYAVINGICYKSQYYHYYEASEGVDYKVLDGIFYTMDDIKINDESENYDGFVIIKNGRYYFNDNLYFHHIMSTVGYEYVKVNNDFYRLIQTYENEELHNYALIDGKLYPVIGNSIGKSVNLDVRDIISEDEISIPSLNNISGDESIEIKLPADATGTVTLTVDGKNYIFDVKNGVANVKLPELTDGNYDYTITYSGDSKYSSFSTNGNMKVNNTKPEDTKPTPEIVIPPLDEPSADGSVTITLPNDATGKVTLSINGKDYSYLVENGVANVIIPNLGEGNYLYTITYSGDSKYSSFTTNGSLNKSAPKVDPKITAKNTAVQYSAKGKYSVTVYGVDGKVASGVYVIFKISGKQVAKVKTNSKGVANYVVTKNPGKYKIQATALGKSVTKTLTVKHIVTLKTTTLKKSAKKLTLQASLAKVNGKYLKKKTITFKINGKKVATAKTNSKGVAKITIKNPSVVKKLKVGKKVTYQATYLKDTVKKTAKIKK